jgi:predicted O-linked N-acetylglucosamine transferase (SPINDLY family)
VGNATDEDLAQTIRDDRIDVLVDLALHTSHNRLLTFARKPAPVQVTYLAYPGTTGLSAIDYRLTDPNLDPPGSAELPYSEQSFWLPETYWCYRPLDAVAHLRPAARAAGRRLTFGSLNAPAKLSAPALRTWAKLLRLVPDSSLLLCVQCASTADRLRRTISNEGVSPERVEFTSWQPHVEYLRLYDRIDVALDPFPYGGGATTCDALWMGVPVVTLAGRTAVGRGGKSILSNVGLSDLVADDTEEYVAIAMRLAFDESRRLRLRANLRKQIEASPLMDALRFARNVEAAYRQMWRRWCDESLHSPTS